MTEEQCAAGALNVAVQLDDPSEVKARSAVRVHSCRLEGRKPLQVTLRPFGLIAATGGIASAGICGCEPRFVAIFPSAAPFGSVCGANLPPYSGWRNRRLSPVAPHPTRR